MKKFFAIVLLLGITAFVVLKLLVHSIQGTGPEIGQTDVRFREVTLEHEQVGDLDASLPFMGLSAIDIDGDGVDELFIGGGHGSEDALFRFNGTGFAQIVEATGFTKGDKDMTFGSSSLDVTGDGLDDLFVARESGVYMYINEGGANFQGEKIPFDLAENTTPLSIALGDIEQDGDCLLYTSPSPRDS